MTPIQARRNNFATRTRRRSPSAVVATLTITALVAASALLSGTAEAAPKGEITAVPTVVAAAAAAGKLTPRGCTVTGTGKACDLFAMAGTTPILGNPVPIWGFSSTGAAGSATAPGPVLVVNQGDAVSITVHNQLVGENVSLALPGQAATAFTGSPGDDLSGIAAGATRTYSFTADRPGTFLYQAGHTPNGARQVAMGLAGALVVLPSGTSAGTAYGPGTSYDDDAVLVMTEIDPALNANPTGFDLRSFAPKYRMFNGKPYPAADPISTDQSHKVLLRYVNAGSQTHAMSVLGGDQVEIAEDGHPMAYQSTVTAESVQPGQTLDTIVTMPSGPEAKLAVYEPAMHLDNNGQHTADPLQFAFGGLLTFLDTNAPPPSTDSVGPVSTHVTVSPNPSDAKADVTVTADLSDATTGGSMVSQAEFVIDDTNPIGVGYGTPMSGTFGTVGVTGATGTIPAVAITACGAMTVSLNCLDAGKHTIFVRALDAAGNWGVVGSVIFNLPKTGPQTTGGTVTSSPANGASTVDISATGDDSAAGGRITNAEYFIDTITADGTGTALTLNQSATVVSEDAIIAAATVHDLTEGTHHIYVHSKDSLNLWGPTLDLPLVVDLTGPGVDAAAVGPNPSNGILSDKSNPGYLVVSAQITDRDAGGAAQSNLVGAEAFLQTVKAAGTGLQLIAVDGKLDSTTESVYGLIPISQIKALASGTYQVYVHGQDAAGNWGPTFAVNLVVDKVAPILGALTATPNPTNGVANLTLSAPLTEPVGLRAAEFWIGTTDPGVGKGTQVPVSIVNGAAIATVLLAGIPAGAQQFNLRVQDTAGNWSTAVSTSVTVTLSNAIFTGLFEGTTSDWSAAVGVSTSAAAKMTSTVEPASTQGLVAAVRTGTTTAARLSYVTDTTPAAETSYHASFQLNANTLASGTAGTSILTLFDGRTAAGGQIFSVQFHRSAAGVRQIRAVMARSGGATAAVGTWVTLPTGVHSIQVDWRAGLATGTSPGSLLLKVDGVTVVGNSFTGNTNTLRLETVRLGIVAGVVTGTGALASSGSAFFDGFTSTRYTL